MKANKTRKVHTQEFKAEALKLAERIGVAAAARELKVYESQLYSWRTTAQKKSSTSAREAEQAAEIARLKRQLAEQAEELAIFKKGGYLLREEPKIARFEFILEHQHQFSLKRMVNVLNVSRSGYYAWRKHGQTVNPREQRQIERDEAIKQAFIDSKERSGARRIQVDLAELDMTPDIKTIRNSMIRQGLVPKAARKFKVTTDSKHNQPVAPNLLEQDFTARAPNQKWVGDITYLFTSEGWLYLAVIIDLYSRSVVGWSMSNRMTATLVCDALKMALFRRGFPEGIIVHSDRGSQYCSDDYRDLIKKHRLTQSMSRKGNCWDNACAESFFHSLKVEALQDEPIMDRENMRRAVFEYIEVDYNKTRRHSAIGYLSPENFELKNSA
ncbi:IS3 family transposase [Pseudidiomarina mangrovi]|uniref:IS3 family transposase n=1 Tax=Pseudidiomarina mangrovi TaxID=2487133 RepID=UPI000FCB6971|nr:IS3 family transposase [Pseudidiomarina mangrovi]